MPKHGILHNEVDQIYGFFWNDECIMISSTLSGLIEELIDHIEELIDHKDIEEYKTYLKSFMEER